MNEQNPFSGLRAVLLDAAGTLISTAEPVGDTYARWARRFGSNLTAKALGDGFRHEFCAMPPMAFAGVTAVRLAELERNWWRNLVQRVVDHSGRDLERFDEFFDAVFQHFASPDAWRLYPEVVAVLRALQARGYSLAVVSNFDSRLLGILEGLGLAPFLDVIEFSTAAGAAKPDPRIFAGALKRLELDADQALHVGDGLHNDYQGARDAGLHALLLRRGAVEQAEPGIDCIASLQALLTRLPGNASAG